MAKEIFKRIALVGALSGILGLFLIVADDWRAALDPVQYFERQLGKTEPVLQALFSPDDSIKDYQIDLIEHEQESLDIAIFSFTDPDTAQAVLDAYKRGVKVRIVCDRGSSVGEFSKILLLRRAGIPIYVCPTTLDENKVDDKAMFGALMHNKFIIFGKTVGDKRLLWTGSFNFTRTANARNQENVIILSDATIIERYAQQFEKLFTRSEQL